MQIIEVNSGYAIVEKIYERGMAFSRPYMLVCEFYEYNYGYLRIYDTSDYSYIYLDNSYTEIYVNGIKQSDSTTYIELKDGNNYEIKYLTLYNDEKGELPCW